MSLADHAASRAQATAQDAKAASWDELLQPDGRARRAAAPLVEHLESLGVAELAARQDAADLDMLAMGVTFTVYSDGRGIDRAWPFDVIPRVIDATEWRRIEAGLVQRLQALNQFIDDLYNDQQVDRRRRLPGRAAGRRLPTSGPSAWASDPGTACGPTSAAATWCATHDGTVYVLEDNLRVPSGVSYLLENRLVSKRAFADLFAHQSIQPVDDYPDQLFRLLASLAPDEVVDPTVVVLTPGVYNSAYFEHSFLAHRMGVAARRGPRPVRRGRRRASTCAR